nr:hypothetical protein [Butyrivibrio sp.]
KFTITPYITSYDSSSDDDNEKVIYFIPQPNVEETDTGFDISIKNKKLIVNWEKLSNASGYEVYVSKKQNSGYKKRKSTNNASTVTATISKLNGSKFNAKKTYYIYVVAKKTVSGTTYKSSVNYVYVYKNGHTYIGKYNG